MEKNPIIFASKTLVAYSFNGVVSFNSRSYTADLMFHPTLMNKTPVFLNSIWYRGIYVL